MPESLTPSYVRSLPKWLTVYIPLLIPVYTVILMMPALNWEEGLNREFGLVENLTAIFLLAAFIVTLRSFQFTLGKFHLFWLILLALGSFVFFGEEISWGQHFFGWGTPDDWKELNRQGETNIHNLNGTVEFIFTKVIRNLLSTGCIVGGFVVPFIYKRLNLSFAPTNVQFWLWPSIGSALTGILVNCVNIPDKIANHFDIELPNYLGDRVGELKEVYMALFILLYALVQYRVAKDVKARRS